MPSSELPRLDCTDGGGRCIAPGLALGVAALLVAAPAAPSQEDGAPRTSWGAPDLQGIWTNATLTPLERPEGVEGAHYTEAEAARLETQTAARIAAQDGKIRTQGGVGGYNNVWLDYGMKVVPGLRTSLIVDPADGRIPWAPGKEAESDAERARYGVGPYDSHVDLDTGERCLSDGATMAPLMPYNMNYRIVQTPDHVMIWQEMYHEARVIPLGDVPRLEVTDSYQGAWLGEPRGRWEGDTLVIESVNFAPKDDLYWAWPWRAARPSLRIVERLRRVDETTLDYEFTVSDPESFKQPWTATAPMTTDQASRGVTAGKLFEYACHEGNYSLLNVLRGARAQEGRDLSR